MSGVADGITADSVLIGGASAQAAANGEDDADTGGWSPGDSGTAARRAGELGLAALLLSPGSGSGGGADVPDIAGDMEDGYLGVVSRVLAGWDPDTAADELGSMLADAVSDGAYAVGLTVTQITIVAGQAALQWYLSNTTSLLQWVAVEDSRTCPSCLENAAAEPRRAGVSWPAGAVAPPQHMGGCRCSLIPVWLNAPPGPDVIDETGDAGGDVGDEEAGEPEDSAEGAGDEGGETEGEGEEPEGGPEEAAAESEGPLKDFSPLEFATPVDASAWLKDNAPDLTAEQRETLQWFTGSGSGAVNWQLRDGRELPDVLAAKVAELDEMMAPLPADLVLDRVVGASAFGGADLEGLAGQVITDPAFQSTSLGGASLGRQGVIMRIAATEGTPAILGGPLTAVPAEREVLLARGTQLAVQSVELMPDGQWEMLLTVVPAVAKAAAAGPSGSGPAPGEGDGAPLTDRQADARFTIVGPAPEWARAWPGKAGN